MSATPNTRRNAPRCSICGFVNHGNQSHRCPPRFAEFDYVVMNATKAQARCPDCNLMNEVNVNDRGGFCRACQHCKATYSGVLPRFATLAPRAPSRATTPDPNPQTHTAGT